MTTHEERQRLAAMGNALRPDWPAKSLYTLLCHEVVVTRAYHDVAMALAMIATDPDTRNPGRLHEPGPWWPAPAGPIKGTAINITGRCPRCGGLHTPADECDPPEARRSRGRGAAVVRQALRKEA